MKKSCIVFLPLTFIVDIHKLKVLRNILLRGVDLFIDPAFLFNILIELHLRNTNIFTKNILYCGLFLYWVHSDRIKKYEKNILTQQI